MSKKKFVSWADYNKEAIRNGIVISESWLFRLKRLFAPLTMPQDYTDAFEREKIALSNRENPWCATVNLACSPPQYWDGEFPYTCVRCKCLIRGIGG